MKRTILTVGLALLALAACLIAYYLESTCCGGGVIQ